MSEQIEHKTASSRMFITPYAQQRERGIVTFGGSIGLKPWF